MNLYHPTVAGGDNDSNFVGYDSKDFFIKGRKSFEMKKNHFQKMTS